ncbi:MAG: hypothetical protein GX786_06430 [Clostridiales bacterium]|nr:hypothetical protein [Clostridiales bacterium]
MGRTVWVAGVGQEINLVGRNAYWWPAAISGSDPYPTGPHKVTDAYLIISSAASWKAGYNYLILGGGTKLGTNTISNIASNGNSSPNSIHAKCKTGEFPANGGYLGLQQLGIQGLDTPSSGSPLRFYGSTSLSLYVTWEVSFTACSPPTSLSLSASLAEGNITLSGSGAKAGTQNNINSYEIQYAESSNGSSWGGWTGLTTVNTSATSFSASVSPSGTRGNYRKFRVRTRGSAGADYYSGWKESGAVRKNQLPSSPGGLNASPDLFEKGMPIALSWGASIDPDGNLKDYELQYASYTPDGSVHTPWTYEKYVSGTTGQSTYDTLPNGYLARWQIRARDELGAVSGFIGSNWIKKNSPPEKIASLSVSHDIYESGGITVSWKNPSDPDNNYSHQRLQYQVNNGSWADLGNVPAENTVHSPTLSSGSTIRYRSCSVDALGATSDWVYSAYVKKNSPPSMIIVKTLNNKTIFNQEQVTLELNCPKDVDGDQTVVRYSVNNGQVKSFTPLKEGEYYFEGRFVPAGIGANQITLWLEDARGSAGAKTSIIVQVASPNWKRPIKTGDIIANKEISHVADINEVVSKLNTCRGFYGLGTVALPFSINLFSKWKNNMAFLLEKILETAAFTGRSWEYSLEKEEKYSYPNAGDFNLLRTLIIKL